MPGIVLGTYQVLRENCLLESSTSSPALCALLSYQALKSTGFAAVPVTAPWADNVGQSSGLWTAKVLSLLILNQAYLEA